MNPFKLQHLSAKALIFFLSMSCLNIHAQKQHSLGQPSWPWMENSASKGMNEIPAMRDRYTKHYQMPNGKYKMISSVGPIHYQTKSGWDEIDNSIQIKKDGRYDTYPYFNDRNSFITKYPSKVLDLPIITTLPEGEMRESIEAVYATDANGTKLYTYNANACQAVEVNDETIQYQHVYANASVKYTQQSQGRRFDFIIQNKQFLDELSAQSTYLIIKEKLVLPSSWHVQPSENGYDIYQGKKWISHIETPFAMDHDQDEMVAQLMVEQKNGYVNLYSSFPISWLKDAQRKFPITLDPTISVYPDLIAFTTGNMTGPVSAKTSGNIRMAQNGAIAWAKFNLASLPPGSTISSASYHGNHFNGISSTPKHVTIVGMQGIDPVGSINTQVYSQITTAGPTYNADYVFAGATVPTWYADTLNVNGLIDIAAQQTQGWTALGFKYLSGTTSTQIQYGYNAAIAANKPYLELIYNLVPCSGTPNPGNTLASTTLTCPTTPVHLSIQNALTLGSGLSYQWYNSAGAISGATNSTCDVMIGATADSFWCDITCIASSSSALSTPVLLGGSSPLNCYCISTATASQDADIYNVTLNGNSTNPLYSNANGCLNVAPGAGSVINKYSNFFPLGSLSTIAQGALSSFEVRVNDCDGPAYFANGIGIWIDYNQNGLFTDPGENVYLQGTASAGTGLSPAGDKVASGIFYAPITAVLGQTVTRVVCAVGIAGSALSPCITYAYGETEDYIVTIISSACSGTPNPGNTLATLSSVCSGMTTNLSIQNVMGTGIAYQWYNNAGAITGATNATYTATIISNDSFYCATTCIASGITTNSVPVYVQVATAITNSSTEIACDLYTWNSAVLNASGVYTGTFTSVSGCDSIHTLNLTINQSSTSNITITQCDSVMFGGVMYYANDTATAIFAGALGCDSIVNAIINVPQSSSSSMVQSGCNFYLLNGTTYTSSGLYTQSFTNMAGCDSTLYLDLTINPSTDSIVNAVSCNGYTFNGQTYTATGSYSQTFVNSAGCDSTVTLDVSIDTLNATITISGVTISTPAIGTYQWMNCDSNTIIPGATNLNFIPTVSGSYAVIVSAGSCVDTSICLPFYLTNTNDIQENELASIYPNPNHGHFELNLAENATVFIMNNIGEIISHQAFKKGKHDMNISSFASGIYFVKVKTENSNEIIKVVKE